MGWSLGFDTDWKRDVGYGVPSVCDHPDCKERIDRGLSYVCGGEPYGGEHGCGLFFCENHLGMSDSGVRLCQQCREKAQPFEPKPDTPEWIKHKLTDPSWSKWRAANIDEVARLMVGPPRDKTRIMPRYTPPKTTRKNNDEDDDEAGNYYDESE